MTNQEMRALLKDARTYNGTSKSRLTWSDKVDKMHDQQVYEVFERLNSSMHIYLVPVQLDGYPMGFYDTGKTWSTTNCVYGSPKLRDKLESKFLTDHPEFNNCDLRYVFADELPYKSQLIVHARCESMTPWQLKTMALNAPIVINCIDQKNADISGDITDVIMFLVSKQVKVNKDFYGLLDFNSNTTI